METNITLAAMRPPESLVATNVCEQLREAASRRYYIWSSMILPAVANAIVRDATTLSRIRLAQTALAIERYRAQHNRPPENLMDLTPAFLSILPIDSFTGEPLRYRRMDNGFVIYSVGRDGFDNGGLEMPLNAKSNDIGNYDLTFTVLR